MSSWYSNIVGATSNKISNLQRSLLSSEADGDTEDDTHVCRVLRGYYDEKGLPRPGWLPPDPRAPPPVQAVYAQPQASRYGGLQPQQGPSQGGLSSLWDNNPAQQPQEVQSLRRGRGAAPMRPDLRNSPFRNSEPAVGAGAGVQARPLPSQRAGSHQSPYYDGGGSATPPAGSSASDRLRKKMIGGTRTTSPAASGPFHPPAQAGGYDPYGGRPGGVPARKPPGGSGGLPGGPRMMR